MNDFTLDNVNEMYIDVLREIGNIGAGNATTSLASMINEQIDMNVPQFVRKTRLLSEFFWK